MRFVLVATGGIACGLLLFWLALVLRTRPAPPAPRYYTSIRTAKLDVSNGSRMTLSRDGRRIAFIAFDESGVRRLMIRALDSDVVQTVASATDAREFPFWSPDGQSLGYFTTNSLNTVDLATGRCQKACRCHSYSARCVVGP